jgi:ADP-ribosylglycohydrolase
MIVAKVLTIGVIVGAFMGIYIVEEIIDRKKQR